MHVWMWNAERRGGNLNAAAPIFEVELGRGSEFVFIVKKNVDVDDAVFVWWLLSSRGGWGFLGASQLPLDGLEFAEQGVGRQVGFDTDYCIEKLVGGTESPGFGLNEG